MLSQRRQRVLNALVDEYVASAAPVGSQTLVRRYLTDVSSATVRSELMRLEAEGYVLQPHTSAGRVPTHYGYRVFVNKLLLHETSETPRLEEPADRIPRVKTPALATASPLAIKAPEAFGAIAISAADYEGAHHEPVDTLSASTGLLSLLLIQQPSSALYLRGLARLLAQPEFRDSAALVPLLQVLESTSALTILLETSLKKRHFSVCVGIESERGQLSSFSLVAERVRNEHYSGVLAVLGPMRMDYRKAIRSVDQVSRIIDCGGGHDVRRDTLGC
jgi:transcriptional regulator of heat shock response